MKTQYLDIKREGFEKHIKTSIWNVVELIKHYIYLTVFILRAYAYCRETVEIQNDPQAAFIPRQNWDMFDPQLIAESLFAIANVLRC